VERIERPFLLRQKHLAGTLVERRQIVHTSSRAHGVFQHPPEACDRVAVMSAVGWQDMAAQLLMLVVEGRVELMRPLAPAPIDDHHHLCTGCAEDRHHWMEILTQLLGIKGRHDFIDTTWRVIAYEGERGIEDKNWPMPSAARFVLYRDRLRLPVARVSRKSSNARRAIMPRFALSPVWTSSWSI
jgi:hypothetical protein